MQKVRTFPNDVARDCIAARDYEALEMLTPHIEALRADRPELARAIGLDPVEFRRRNLVRSGDRLAMGEPVPDAHWRECLVAAVAGLGVGAYAGGLFHLFNHATFKTVLFLNSASLEKAAGTSL